MTHLSRDRAVLWLSAWLISLSLCGCAPRATDAPPPDLTGLVIALVCLLVAAIIAAGVFAILWLNQCDAIRSDHWIALPIPGVFVGIRQPGVKKPSLDTILNCIVLAGRFTQEQLLIAQRQRDADRLRVQKQATEEREMQEQLLAELNQIGPDTGVAGPTWSPPQDTSTE